MTTRSRLTIGLSILLIGVMSVASRVSSNEMAPNIPDGSWVWTVSSNLYVVGDVIAMQDPHNSNRMQLRRIVATADDTVRVQNDGIIVNNKRLPQLDMRPWNDNARVWQELGTNEGQEVTWEFIQSNVASHFQTSELTIQANHHYVMCDNRSECLDSRWWGSISHDLIDGKVIFSVCLFCNDGMKRPIFMLYY